MTAKDPPPSLPSGTKDVDDDYGDKRIVPGFVGHPPGAYGFDTNDANGDGLRWGAHRLGRHQLPRHHHHPGVEC